MKVVTLVHGRRNALANLVRGLEASSLVPEQLCIVHMNEPAGDWASEVFPIRELRVEDADGLPLAKARNAVRTLDPSADWVFLDVDCIPTHDLLAQYQQGLETHPRALHMGQVRYLPQGANHAQWHEATLYRDGVEHPLARYRSGPGQPLPHHLFWSLNFACTAATFARIGGFDEGYRGYGGEDTDFAFRAREHGVALIDSAAMAFHQYHPTYDPPLNHFADIVENARRFRQRWGVWPMEGWLGAFRDLGLLHWDEAQLQIIQPPTSEQVAKALNPRRLGF
ncbi:galactosyltransferase-related protein [Pseudomonas sp. HR96]|uniref:glycosyltransferase family 2 protein n=1 Tax=Pseudomonas sp. HR96 TaxID=1027966 RepID=UPI002A752026|nr:galactosyltransferase-related protein [Pseudomonas sp. HR96]WPO98255.1 galactosyltransferase-related protein [Pseudomonas sp. HR96]